MNKKWLIISIAAVAVIVSLVLAFTLLKPTEAPPETPTPPASSEEQLPESSIPDWHIPPTEDPYMEAPGSYEADDPDIDTTIGDIPYTVDGEEEEYVPEVNIYTEDNPIKFEIPSDFNTGGEQVEIN